MIDEIIGAGKEVVLVRHYAVRSAYGESETMFVTSVYVREPRPLPSFVAHHFEERIANLLGNPNGPGPWQPTREDEVRTFLVGGSGAIEARETASRKWIGTGFTVNACREALAVAQEAEELGVQLHVGYSFADLQNELRRREETERVALEKFQDEDHRLCCTNYNAWRIANK